MKKAVFIIFVGRPIKKNKNKKNKKFLESGSSTLIITAKLPINSVLLNCHFQLMFDL